MCVAWRPLCAWRSPLGHRLPVTDQPIHRYLEPVRVALAALFSYNSAIPSQPPSIATTRASLRIVPGCGIAHDSQAVRLQARCNPLPRQLRPSSGCTDNAHERAEGRAIHPLSQIGTVRGTE